MTHPPSRPYNPDALPAHAEPNQPSRTYSPQPKNSFDYQHLNSNHHNYHQQPKQQSHLNRYTQNNDLQTQKEKDRVAADAAIYAANALCDGPETRRIFDAVDRDGSQRVTYDELATALVNSDYTPFDPHTIRMMIRLFDTEKCQSLSFVQFNGLWAYLHRWRAIFQLFDTNHSGSVDRSDFGRALVAFQYRLSDDFIDTFFLTYAKENVPIRTDFNSIENRTNNKTMSFDRFVQASISLKRMTDVFKKHDLDRDGYITLSFEQYLTGAHALFLFNSISPVTDTELY